MYPYYEKILLRHIHHQKHHHQHHCTSSPVPIMTPTIHQKRFMDCIFHQPCIRYAHRYLVAKGKAPANESQFKELLHQLWFGLYRFVQIDV